MKFIKVFLLLTVAVLFMAGVNSCTKRGKLTNNGIILQIEPASSFSLASGNSRNLRAIVKNVKLEEVSEPVLWSVSDSSLGSFSNTTSKTTVFTAGNTGSGTITLTCQGYSVSLSFLITAS